MDKILTTTALVAGLLSLSACATPTSKTFVAENYAEPQTQEEVAILTAEKLDGAKNVIESSNGEVVCKRQEIAGSRFKRKICMTPVEWEELATKNRAEMLNLHRRSSQQTVRN